METSFKIGNRVELIEKGLPGTIAYVGSTQFQPGKWIGVVLDEPKGKNNGTVQGKEYFTCTENCGIFVRPVQLKLAGKENESSSSSLTSSVDEKSLASRLPQPGAKRLRLPLKKGDDGSSRESLESTQNASMKSNSRKIITPPKSNRTSGSKFTTPSPVNNKSKTSTPEDTNNNKISPGSKSSSPRTSLGNVFPKGSPLKTPSRPQPELDMTTPLSDHVLSPGSNVAQHVAKISQDMDRSIIVEGIVKNTNAILEGLSEGAQVEYLRSELKDCSEKLETLRLKRQEDKQKLIDYEKCRIQLQQMIEYKTKMTELHAELQRQLQVAKKDAKEAIEGREAYQEEMSGLAESVEMATLDKEVAEERAELLQAEVETLKERVQELETDLELLKNEMAESGASGSSINSVQLKQLEQQNERLKEAVVKMRDLSAHERREQQRATKELEQLKMVVSDLSKKNDKLNAELQTYELSLAELKEQVDAALGSEEMVEQLTAKNLALEEKVIQLEESIEDFEQMRAMDEELQESTKEFEKEMRNELDAANAKLAEVKACLKKSQDQVHDHEQTIQKFRHLTAQYQGQIQDLKDKLLIRDNEEKRDAAENDESAPRRYSYVQTKAWAEIVENELRRLELETTLQHVRYLRSFLPDNFNKPGGDNDCVMLTLLFPRLSAKTCLLVSQLNDLYPNVPGGMRPEHVLKSHKGEQWSFVYKMTYYLNGLLILFHKFESVLTRCSVERLLKLAQSQPEMLSQERHLDHYFDLLKTNRLDENVPFDGLDKILAYFQHFWVVHLSTEEFDHIQYANDNIKRMFSAFAWLKNDLTRAKFTVLENTMTADLGNFFSDCAMLIDEAEKNLMRLKTVTPADSKLKILKLSSEVCDSFLEANAHIEKTAKLVHQACAVASTQVSMLPDVEGIEATRFEELLQNAANQLADKGLEKQTYDDLAKLSIGLLMNNIAKLIEAIDKGKYDSPTDVENKSFPPILERAHVRKQDAVEAESLRWQLEKKANEVKEMKLALRQKAEEVSEMKVRKEMAESRLQTTGKEGDERLTRLQRQIDELNSDMKRKEADFDKVMDSWQKEIDDLEKENAELKERYKMLTKKSLLQGISTQAAFGTGQKSVYSAIQGESLDVACLSQQLEELKAAFTQTHLEKCALQGAKMQRIMADLPPLCVPKKPASALSADLDQLTHRRHDEINHMMRECVRLQKEYCHSWAVAKIIDVSKHHCDSTLDKQRPAYAYVCYVDNLRKFSEWIKHLKYRIERHRKEASLRSNQLKIRAENHDQLIGRVIIGPCDPSSKEKRRIIKVNLTLSQLDLLRRKIAA